MKKSGVILTAVAGGCAAFFLLCALIFGFQTGFGLNDFQETMDDGVYTVPYAYTETIEHLSGITVEWASGPVQLSVYDGTEIRVTETAKHALKEEEKLTLEISGGKLILRWNSSMLHLNFMRSVPKKLEIQIPKTLLERLRSVSVRTGSGSISCSDFTADRFELITASGDIEAENLLAQEISLSSASGKITAAGLTAEEQLSVSDTSGDTTLSAVQAQTVQLHTTSGALSAACSAKALSCETISGAVTLSVTGETESVFLSSVSGAVQAQLPGTVSGCSFSTVSGALQDQIGLSKAEEEEAMVIIRTTSAPVLLRPVS